MDTMHILYTDEEVTDATRLLLEMRDNCYYRTDCQAHDDPERMEKYKALNIALDALGRMPTCSSKSCD